MQKSKVKSQKFNLKRKSLNFFLVLLPFAFYLLTFIGCATVPRKEAFPTYDINGTTYLPLISLCNSSGINWDYDTLTRTVILTKDSHRINLRVGDALILVDGLPARLRYPVDIYQGTIVVPYKFKEQTLDVLFRKTYPVSPAVPYLIKIKRVVIDAGHGGNDPGAIGRSGVREKDVNLDIAKRLSKLLRSYGIEVVMTRSTDTFIPLSRRVDIANNSGSDLFISIHSNANRVRSLNGFEIYYVSPTVNDSKRAYATAKYAALNLEDASFASQSLDLKAILWDMIYTSSRAESIELSRSICRSMDDTLGSKILGVKGARFEVLRGAHMPAVLIEIGFLSNKNEERKLRNNYYRQKIAEGIMQGIQDYAQNTALIRSAKR